MSSALNDLPARDEGATAIEYAILAASVAAVAAVTIGALGIETAEMFSAIADRWPP